MTSRCPIVDTWWQTETGGILITPLPGATRPLKPGSATRPFFGIKPVLVDDRKAILLEGAAKAICASRTAGPGQMRTVYGDHERFIRDLFLHYQRQVFHRRRLPARCRRLLLDHRAGR